MLKQFEQFLEQNLPKAPSYHPHYEKALSMMFQAGGKRFRPMLLLHVVQAYNPLLISGAMYAALAIESLHTYSLIHDDLPAMDDAPLRRGFETLHVTYDDVTAILAGDALNTYAFELLADAPLSSDVRIRLVELLAKAGGTNGMVLGQAIDCHFENHPLTLDELKVLHLNKTGKLIAAALAMGAAVIDNSVLQKQLYNFGLDLGLLFQIQDDILDVTQSDEEAGKTTNNDGNKNSFVNLLGLDGAVQSADELAASIDEQFKQFDTPLQESLGQLISKYLTRHKD
jgi:farnesyl diphosphate synthase